MRRLSWVFAVALLILGLGNPAAGAGFSAPLASSGPLIDTVVLDGQGSQLTLTFDAPVSEDKLMPELSRLLDWETESISGTRVQLAERDATSPQVQRDSRSNRPDESTAAAAGYQSIYCGFSYGWSDSQGTFTLQRQCGVNKAPWGYKISPALQSIAASSVNEAGMQWWRNGTYMPQMAPHVAPASYVFHGTFTVKMGDYLDYQDVFTFRHNMGSGGTVRIVIYGQVRFRGSA